MSLRWSKLYNAEWIDGSIRVDLTPAERSVWADFIALAGLSRREGHIERSQGIPYTITELSNRLMVDVDTINSTINKCIKEGRITVDDCNTIIVTNWAKYQKVPDKIIAKNNAISKNKDKADKLSGNLEIASTEIANLRKDINTATAVFVEKKGE